MGRLNYYETGTGIKLVLNTDTAVTHPIVRDLLAKIYSQVHFFLIPKTFMDSKHELSATTNYVQT